ncbi:MAG: YCF48-related protein [Steroidobacteraceae bacterium]|jgi:photosystem II stability/assembly factor-like uncharacterized protein|nr:YCF48-related protein [Steroidobacteraceae bacterium]
MIRRGFAALAAPLLALAGGYALGAEQAGDAAAEPSWIAPLAPKSLLLDLARAGSRVFAVGERGHVLYSDDEGRTWTQVQVPASANLTAVYFLDETRGWAVGHDEVILRTTDGGKTWARTHFDPEAKQPLLDVWFGDPDRGLAVGAYGVIYESRDGGTSWERVDFEPEELGAVAPAAGEDEYDDVDVGIDFHLNAVVPGPGDRLYLAAEAGRLYRSDDAGARWYELPSPYDGSFYGILPLDGDALLAFGLRGNVFRSEDGGKTWTEIPTETVALLHGAARISAETIAIAGTTGVILVSSDGGRSFAFSQQDDRKGFAAVLATSDGELIVAGETGVKRLPLLPPR